MCYDDYAVSVHTHTNTTLQYNDEQFRSSFILFFPLAIHFFFSHLIESIIGYFRLWPELCWKLLFFLLLLRVVNVKSGGKSKMQEFICCGRAADAMLRIKYDYTELFPMLVCAVHEFLHGCRPSVSASKWYSGLSR